MEMAASEVMVAAGAVAVAVGVGVVTPMTTLVPATGMKQSSLWRRYKNSLSLSLSCVCVHIEYTNAYIYTPLLSIFKWELWCSGGEVVGELAEGFDGSD